MKNKIYIGITQDDELYYIEIEQPSENHDYFAMSGTTLRLLDAEEAEASAREQLEDGEYWKDAVRADMTTDSLDDWVENVLSIDGWESQFDIDWKIGQREYQGKDYYFEFSSGGQHEETDFKKLFISKEKLDELMQTWKKYHSKRQHVAIVLPEQEQEKIINESLKFLLS